LLLTTGWDHFDTDEVGFKELYQLFSLVTNQLGQEPIVIDADDLLKQPGLRDMSIRTYFMFIIDRRFCKYTRCF